MRHRGDKVCVRVYVRESYMATPDNFYHNRTRWPCRYAVGELQDAWNGSEVMDYAHTHTHTMAGGGSADKSSTCPSSKCIQFLTWRRWLGASQLPAGKGNTFLKLVPYFRHGIARWEKVIRHLDPIPTTATSILTHTHTHTLPKSNVIDLNNLSKLSWNK